jgi:signal transduction histidine kinase
MWLDDVFMEVFESSRCSFDTHQVDLMACEPAYVLGDPDRLRQVLLNLIDNAVKFSPPNASIAMELKCLDNQVVARISDHGPGITPQNIERIFNPFFRGAKPQNHSGAGLGLTIARWIVREHGGELMIESQVGEGTKAIIILPEKPQP